MAVAVILLSVLLMFFMALTSAAQRTIRALGLFQPPESEVPVDARAQTMILLGIYLRRLNPTFLLAMGVYLIISRASTWYSGLAVVILCWIGSLLIGTTPFLRPGSFQVVALLVADLERRRAWYRNAGNPARLHAVEDLLVRLRSITGMQPTSRLQR
ncbi:MAG TPA: hypothetical protein VLT62_14635 [Candidatus Methylomirabilis sp.]|nr:hypothetical protein [Candidatus Methylomirabilis sp.]